MFQEDNAKKKKKHIASFTSVTKYMLKIIESPIENFNLQHEKEQIKL